MKTNSKLIILITALYVLVFSTKPAFAYLDPGTGSMLIQGLIAAVAALTVSIGIFWGRLKSFWGRLFGRKNSKMRNIDDN